MVNWPLLFSTRSLRPLTTKVIPALAPLVPRPHSKRLLTLPRGDTVPGPETVTGGVAASTEAALSTGGVVHGTEARRRTEAAPSAGGVLHCTEARRGVVYLAEVPPGIGGVAHRTEVRTTVSSVLPLASQSTVHSTDQQVGLLVGPSTPRSRASITEFRRAPQNLPSVALATHPSGAQLA